MSSQLDFLEITCDAPPYDIVRACESIGFWAPLDVRWRRMNGIAPMRTGWWRRLWHHPWQTLRRLDQPSELHCTCGYSGVNLRKFKFTFLDGEKAYYVFG